MEIITSNDEWHKAFKAISEEFDFTKGGSFYTLPLEFFDDENIDDDDISSDEIKKKDSDHRDHIMKRMRPLFACQPKLEKVCEKSRNHFIRSGFKNYYFDDYNNNLSANEFYDKVEDFKYTITLCGYNLTSLTLKGYPFSDLMPLIKINCPNLENLELKFKKIKDEHFENVFSNMFHLNKLIIEWECDNSTIPITLINSLEQVGGTLKIFFLYGNNSQKNYLCLPDDLAKVFPKLTALKNLRIHNFDQNQVLFESIGKIKSLVHLILTFEALMIDPNFNKKYDMYPIGNLNNLKSLYMYIDYGVTDEFLINLSNNAKQLKTLSIIGTNITDDGLIAINRFKELEYCSLDVKKYNKKNEFITDKSVSRIRNRKLIFLNISNCIKITDISITILKKTLPRLKNIIVA